LSNFITSGELEKYNKDGRLMDFFRCILMPSMHTSSFMLPTHPILKLPTDYGFHELFLKLSSIK
jgi:hypothetical protein